MTSVNVVHDESSRGAFVKICNTRDPASPPPPPPKKKADPTTQLHLCKLRKKDFKKKNHISQNDHLDLPLVGVAGVGVGHVHASLVTGDAVSLDDTPESGHEGLVIVQKNEKNAGSVWKTPTLLFGLA